MPALKVSNLNKEYKGFSLKNINFELPYGCIMGLVGENGAGKSTTIKLILDMLNRDSGTITVLGKDNKCDLHITKEEIGVVLDEVGIPECLKVDQIGKIMQYSYKNWSQSDYKNNIKRLKIPTNKQYKEFSRGMKMKLGIAIALSHKPKLLILDEATNGLDPVVRDDVIDMLNDFTRDEKHSVLISSHIVSDLEKICDYIAFLHKGELILCEEKDLIKEKYGVVHCGMNELDRIPSDAVLGKKTSSYGIEAIVKREAVPKQMQINTVDIEQLFIFMVKQGA